MDLIKTLLIVLLAFLTGFFFNSYFDKNNNSEEWKPALRIQEDGSVLLGSTESLIDALRKGYNLRLAWGWKKEDKSIEHIVDPIWIAIINEEEVIVHLDPQVLSRVDWENQSANYEDSTLHDYEWRVVISTKGAFDAVWYNRKTNEVHRRMPQKHLMTWLIKYPDDSGSRSKPLFSKDLK